MPDLLGITHDEMLAELRRELRQRAKVYPRLVQEGKLSATRAEKQIEALESVLKFMEEHAS